MAGRGVRQEPLNGLKVVYQRQPTRFANIKPYCQIAQCGYLRITNKNLIIKMKLSPYVLKKTIEISKDSLSGPKWVDLMCNYGFNDIYDEKGLPDIGKVNGQRPSRKEYLFKRLSELNDSPKLCQLLVQLFNITRDRLDVESVNAVLARDNYAIEDVNGGFVILGDVKFNDNRAEVDAKFEGIQSQILASLDKAKAIIWVAMAWFTNETLAAKLIEKHNQGLDVRVVLFDDYVNRKHGVELAGIPVKKIKGKHGGKMHHKYCVIDNQKVITGSYNWSDNAEYKNDEDIHLTQDNVVASKYSVDFLSLFNRM